MVDWSDWFNRAANFNTRDKNPPSTVRGKVRDGYVAEERHGLDKGEIIAKNGEICLSLAGYTKNNQPAIFRVFLAYEPDLQKMQKFSDSKFINIAQIEDKLTRRMRETCRYIFNEYTSEELIKNKEAIELEVRKNIEHPATQLYGLRIIDVYSGVEFQKVKKIKKGKAGIDDLLNEDDDPWDFILKIAKSREKVIREKAENKAFWYVTFNPQPDMSKEFSQLVYTAAFYRYYDMLEKKPELRGAKFGQIVPDSEIEEIIDNLYRRYEHA